MNNRSIMFSLFRTLAALTIFSLFVFSLTVSGSTAFAKEGEGGEDKGGSREVKRVIIIHKSSRSYEIEERMEEIERHWDREYKLLIPNSNPKINNAVVQLAKVSPNLATYIADLIRDSKISKQKIRNRIRMFIRRIKSDIKTYIDRIKEIDQTNPKTINKLIHLQIKIGRYSAAAVKLEPLLNALED